MFQIPIVNYQQLLDFNLIQTKIKSDPGTNTEEQINIKHIEFTFCNLHYLHYVKCNKLWNFYAGFFFHCFCWIGFSRQRAVHELKLDETYVPDYISWQSNDFFSPFLLEDEKKCYRQEDMRDECIYIVKRNEIYLYKIYQTIGCCRVAANSWSSDGMTIQCLALS